MNIERARVPISRESPAEGPAGPAVLHVVDSFMPPSEHWVYEQIRNVRRYRSVVASRSLDNPRAHPWSPVYSMSLLPTHARVIERMSRNLRGLSPFLSSVSRAEKAVLWHSHGGHTSGMVLGSARRLRIPLITSFYGFDLWKHPQGDDGLSRRYAQLFRHGTLFLVEGPAAAAQLVRIGAPDHRIRIHRLGVDVAALSFVERQPQPGMLRVLMAARFVEKKGFPYGVEAFCRAATRYSGMRLTIVGGGTGKRAERVTRQIDRIVERHQMHERIEMRAFMPRQALLDLALQHDVLLHPSVRGKYGDREGGHPVIMTLVAATGMPIIATHHCDIPQIVLDGETGWLCEERDVRCLEHALVRAAENPAMLAPMGRSARAHTVAQYDLPKISLDALYDEVLPGARNTTSNATGIRS
jgi:colanic acid/amylovoran biosynthesis glycosyltransferase